MCAARLRPSAASVALSCWCSSLRPSLKERGFILVGIDVIGDYMTEINVTSPTGVREVKRFGGADIASLFWDVVEDKRK